ncbi:Orotidine 5'-phosphate decarboxylase [hydrothermal vent metagenome]|uniref:Orotidine 5'-phosphate decarboxylase n=1 Tax=hydrothermal vent metagenome TaxID=652676 RepID=A0A3B0T036_9ZZZZ
MGNTSFANPVFCGLDTTDKDRALALAGAVKTSVGGLKVGMEAFYALGPSGYAELAAQGLPIFLDLKLHDIPNTVAGGIRALLPLRPAIVNVHATGGMAMMRAAMDAAMAAGEARPKIIAVTVLTSLDDEDLSAAGFSRSAREQALHMARLAREAGLDGVVCSPHEIAAIKSACGADFLTVVPGIRPASASADDQKRVMTPQAALAEGADILVIGRPITAAAEPGVAAADIARGLAA